MTLERAGAGRFRSSCEEDTVAFGRAVAPLVHDGDVLVLTGGLGVGKTHLTKGVARGLGDAHPVTSPTFALMAVHDGGRIPLFHFDLYRLQTPEDLEVAGFYDYLEDGAVVAAEWSENFAQLLAQEKAIRISIVPTGENSREITIEGASL